jgi:hypothetical protein
MAFLNPLVLLGLAAAAIPILIHLFNFRKPRRVDFSSLQFLKEVERSTMRRMRLRQWLLLALRTLAIAFIVLAFARPTVESAWAGLLGARVETATALIVDDSRSMTVRDAQGDLLTQAVELASAVADSRRPGDELFLLTTTRGPLRERAFRQPAAALDALAEIEARPGAPLLGSTLEHAFDLVRTAGPRNVEVVLLSDLQARTFADTVLVPAPEGVRLTLLPLGDRRQANTAVTDARVVSQVLEVGRPALIEATLIHHGPGSAAGVQASLFLEGERVAQATVDLDPGIPVTVQFTATPRQRGWLAGEVRLEADAYPYDDVRYLAVHVPETRRVLVVQGEGQRADLLQLALSLGDEAGGRFDVRVVNEGQLAGEVLEAYQVVILVGLATLATGERAALARYVADGGGVMLFPAAGPNEALSALLSDLGGGRYAPLQGRVGGDEVVARFGAVAHEHPLFEGMLSESDRRGRLESPDFFAVAPAAPAAGQTLIELSGGRPFLHEVRHGRGTALVFAAAPDPRWGDFPTRGLFVPLLHRSVYLLAADGTGGDALVLGEGGSVRLAATSEGLRITGPGSLEFVPEQRAVPGGVIVDIDPTLAEPGMYSVMDGDRLVRRIALNVDAHESDLTPLNPAEAARHLESLTGAPVQVLDASAGRGLAAAHRLAEGHAGVELWNVFLLLALLCLVVEQMVAMRWRPPAPV